MGIGKIRLDYYPMISYIEDVPFAKTRVVGIARSDGVIRISLRAWESIGAIGLISMLSDGFSDQPADIGVIVYPKGLRSFSLCRLIFLVSSRLVPRAFLL